MLENGRGNSYGYAALFYELAYLIGYPDAVPLSGLIYGTQTEFESRDGSRVEAPKRYKPYAWVELTEMGILYLYDPTADAQSSGWLNMYKRAGPVRWQTGYRTF